jgi:hypothetical protein
MARKFRTAVLVVHGMGSQRPLETVRGIVDAVWHDGLPANKSAKRVWTHPEPSGVDMDLTVMTTNAITGKPGDRTADFHELYWAHLMSQTRGVAVLLWLFELGRKGPRFTTAMNALWYCVAIFLCLLLLSVSLLMLQAIVWFSYIEAGPQKLVVAPYVMMFIGVVAGIAVAWYVGALQLLAALKTAFYRFAAPIVFLIAVAFFALIFKARGEDVLSALGLSAAWVTNVFLAPAIALIAAYLLMGKWGLRVFAYAYLLSLCFLLPFFVSLVIPELFHSGSPFHALAEIPKAVWAGRWPWSLNSQSSEVCAWVVIGAYMIANAAFLQPYLGDAARYFRNSPANIKVRREIRKQAVDTLDMLHRLRLYDRIVVVAHSLGTVVAYDMLRAYYSRICDLIPFDPAKLNPEFDEVDNGNLTRDELRRKGRVIIAKMAKNIGETDTLIAAGHPPEAWLVTDFVTLGSPLTHARYLMCNGDSRVELNQDFERRLEEREFPSCPPSKVSSDPDGWLAFKNPRTGAYRLHHGGLFALTRWTNLYFPMSQLFWGDPVGGPVAIEGEGDDAQPLFGTHVKDQEVCLSKPTVKDFFTHTAYWDLKRGDGRAAPQIRSLIEAIDLLDKDKPAEPAGA